MTTADDYVNTVLGMMPPTMPQRAQIAAELRSHIAERLAHGHTMDEVLKQLGRSCRRSPTPICRRSRSSARPSARAPLAKIVDAVLVCCRDLSHRVGRVAARA